MKKIILYMLLLAFPVAAFCQSTPNNLQAVKTDYLQKSKNQKTAAWVLLGSGSVLMTTGVVLAAPKELENILGAQENDYTVENILLITGIAATIGSIPLFIASKKNKKKAMNMTTSIKMEKATIIERQSFVQSSYPAIALKINL
jgi:hypothetical protein